MYIIEEEQTEAKTAVNRRLHNAKIVQDQEEQTEAICPLAPLLNPTKPEIGKISKQILEKKIPVIRMKSALNQWKNS